MFRRSTLLAAAVGVLALPGAASAATLTASATCIDSSQQATVSGTGWNPDSAVSLVSGTGDASAIPYSDGSFSSVEVGKPEVKSLTTPQTVTVTGTSVADPSQTATTSFQVVRFGSNLPFVGKHAAVVSWQFAGFPTGSTIYGHFRYKNEKPRTFKFGTATGECGTLTKKAKRIPVKAKKFKGEWYVQVDTKSKYSSGSQPEYDRTGQVR